jgi:hypothetical protein
MFRGNLGVPPRGGTPPTAGTLENVMKVLTENIEHEVSVEPIPVGRVSALRWYE